MNLNQLKIALYLVIFMSTIFGCNAQPKTVYLIPESYGQKLLTILYEEPSGIKPTDKNGEQTMQFSKDGHLFLNTVIDFTKTEEILNDEYLSAEYYLVDDKGKRTKIAQVVRENDSKKITQYPAIVVGHLASRNSDGLHYENGMLKLLPFINLVLYKSKKDNNGKQILLNDYEDLFYKKLKENRSNSKN